MLTSFSGALLVALALVAVACSTFPVPGVVGTLAVVETRGGHCINAPCGSRIAIESDGRVHQVAPGAAELGTVPSDVMAALSAAVRAADFAAIKSHPFTGECPVNFDGQEVVYEFSRLGDDCVMHDRDRPDPAGLRRSRPRRRPLAAASDQQDSADQKHEPRQPDHGARR